MSKFINPFTDWGFKQVFGREFSKPLLISFLNSLFEGERVIKSITIENNEQPPETKDGRGVIFDINCTDDQGRNFIVGMQKREDINFVERSVYYVSRAIVKQGEKGNEWHYALTPVYCVAFLNFTTSTLPMEFRVDAGLMDTKNLKTVSDKLHLTFLQLPLFEKDKEEECENQLECWIYVLKNMEVFDRMPWAAQNQVFAKLAEISDISKLSKEDRERYDRSLKHFRDIGAAEELAEKRVAESLAKGRAEGRAEGYRDIAIQLKAMGKMTLSEIAELTGMTTSQIEAL